MLDRFDGIGPERIRHDAPELLKHAHLLNRQRERKHDHHAFIVADTAGTRTSRVHPTPAGASRSSFRSVGTVVLASRTPRNGCGWSPRRSAATAFAL